MLLTASLAALAAALLAFTWSQRRVRALGARVQRDAASLESLQRAFQRFAPAEVVESIIAQGVATRSEKKDVTVLFADLRGFTKMSERLDPAVVVEMLNGYFEEMSAAITEHRGHVSKFIGDGILALFGALEPNPWQANDATHAALAMCTRLHRYNETLEARGLPALAIGVGIHRGTVVAGVIGSRSLMEYTVIGADVNLAARVESLTRAHEVDILVTAAVRAALDPRFRLRALPAVEVKGVSEPVATFAVEGFAGENAASSQS